MTRQYGEQISLWLELIAKLETELLNLKSILEGLKKRFPSKNDSIFAKNLEITTDLLTSHQKFSNYLNKICHGYSHRGFQSTPIDIIKQYDALYLVYFSHQSPSRRVGVGKYTQSSSLSHLFEIPLVTELPPIEIEEDTVPGSLEGTPNKKENSKQEQSMNRMIVLKERHQVFLQNRFQCQHHLRLRLNCRQQSQKRIQ